MVSEDRIREELVAAMKPDFISKVRNLKAGMEEIKEHARQGEPTKKPARETHWSKKEEEE
jgi:hypothetical protein